GWRERRELGRKVERPAALDECIPEVTHLHDIAVAQADLRVRLAVHADPVAGFRVHHLPGPIVEVQAQVLARDRRVLDPKLVLFRAPAPDGPGNEAKVLSALL